MFELSINQINNDFDNNNFSSFFDVVISSHVIEHLESIKDHVCLLKRLLKPNGILYLSSPNTDSHDAKKYGSRWRGYKDPTHISLHSLNNILELLTSLDLKVIVAGTSPKSFGIT